MHYLLGCVVMHHHAARVARQSLGRFRGNANAGAQRRLAWLIRVRENGGVDVDHHLIPLARRPRVEVVCSAASASITSASACCWVRAVNSSMGSEPGGRLRARW